MCLFNQQSGNRNRSFDTANKKPGIGQDLDSLYSYRLFICDPFYCYKSHLLLLNLPCNHSLRSFSMNNLYSYLHSISISYVLSKVTSHFKEQNRTKRAVPITAFSFFYGLHYMLSLPRSECVNFSFEISVSLLLSSLIKHNN
jgi:hypothetical protein